MKFSVVIATYNRALELSETLESLKELRTEADWEVIVVDNNSSDNTHTIVSEAAKTFPVELRYLKEKEQGRSAALNAGMFGQMGVVIRNRVTLGAINRLAALKSTGWCVALGVVTPLTAYVRQRG